MKTAYPSPLNLKGIQSIIFELIYDSGLREWGIVAGAKKQERKEVMAVHGFGSFFDTRRTSVTKNPIVTSLLLGHDIGLTGSYFKLDVDTLLQEYRLGMDALTINQENRLNREDVRLSAKINEIQNLKGQGCKAGAGPRRV